MIEITLTPSLPTDFDVDLGGRRYNFRISYNTRAALWHCDLRLDDQVLLSGVPFVIGTRLFRGYEIPQVPQNLILIPTTEDLSDATFDELGTRVRLVQLEVGDALYDSTI